MLFRQSELFRQYIFGTFFFCDPKITAFFRIKLLVFDFFFELLRLGLRGYSDNQVVDPLVFNSIRGEKSILNDVLPGTYRV